VNSQKQKHGYTLIRRCQRAYGGIPIAFMSVSGWCATMMNIQENKSFNINHNHLPMKNYKISRRNFLGTSAVAGLTTLTIPADNRMLF
jgi:hypothetical protein